MIAGTALPATTPPVRPPRLDDPLLAALRFQQARRAQAAGRDRRGPGRGPAGGRARSGPRRLRLVAHLARPAALGPRLPERPAARRARHALGPGRLEAAHPARPPGGRALDRPVLDPAGGGRPFPLRRPDRARPGRATAERGGNTPRPSGCCRWPWRRCSGCGPAGSCCWPPSPRRSICTPAAAPAPCWSAPGSPPPRRSTPAGRPCAPRCRPSIPAARPCSCRAPPGCPPRPVSCRSWRPGSPTRATTRRAPPACAWRWACWRRAAATTTPAAVCSARSWRRTRPTWRPLVNYANNDYYQGHYDAAVRGYQAATRASPGPRGDPLQPVPGLRQETVLQGELRRRWPGPTRSASCRRRSRTAPAPPTASRRWSISAMTGRISRRARDWESGRYPPLAHLSAWAPWLGERMADAVLDRRRAVRPGDRRQPAPAGGRPHPPVRQLQHGGLPRLRAVAGG